MEEKLCFQIVYRAKTLNGWYVFRYENSGYPKAPQIILFGTNDYCLPPDPRHVPKSTYGRNMTDMILSTEVRALKPNILLTSAPPPIERIQVVPGKGKTRDEDTASEYAQELKSVSESLQQVHVYFYDLFTAMMNATEAGDRPKLYAKNDGECLLAMKLKSRLNIFGHVNGTLHTAGIQP
jgi:hypothetical protein